MPPTFKSINRKAVIGPGPSGLPPGIDFQVDPYFITGLTEAEGYDKASLGNRQKKNLKYK